MAQFGYTMMTEQAGPRTLVEDVVGAERAGFDFSVASDHYFPWLDSQGHAPYAWSVLGAAAQATSTIPLMTYVTCPTTRYHPAVVAQKAATLQDLSEGRFRLGLGSGENLNEHVVGAGWPSPRVRLEMLEEAVEIIAALFDGGYVSRRGAHFAVDRAKIWDLPATRVPIGVAVSGRRSCEIAGRLADLVIATEPERELLTVFDRFGGTGKPRRFGHGCPAVVRASERSGPVRATGARAVRCQAPCTPSAVSLPPMRKGSRRTGRVLLQRDEVPVPGREHGLQDPPRSRE
ncbi:TIGR03557 family F420-dependent LLM class oxidoreductase [Streptomyces sp. NPDC032161]|uniref:TIGR03557 family F420-dependent LLM class oxidoreductase n=1 Tax=unclassified Streptomyces TaxID=2593676 RepID=UPI0033C20B04